MKLIARMLFEATLALIFLKTAKISRDGADASRIKDEVVKNFSSSGYWVKNLVHDRDH